ncbi:MAG: hypothetical protein ACJ8AS_04765 [Hyphomicrobiales bacterium]
MSPAIFCLKQFAMPVLSIKPAPLCLAPIFDASKNPIVASIRQMTRRYNILYPITATFRQNDPKYIIEDKMVALLDAMTIQTLQYLLHKPPAARKRTGRAKWDAMVAFKKALVAHADYFGIRFMKADTRDPEGMNYWLERVDTGLTGGQNYVQFLKWRKSREKKSFREAVGPVWSELQYFDETQRQQYVVHFEGHSALDASDEPLDTRSGSGAYSEIPGTFIYVCSARSRTIYSAPSIGGELHHSSFLSGEPVIAAGDWMVDNGKIIYFNASSGHYRPLPGGLELFARTFEHHFYPDTLIQPEHQGPIFLLRDFLLRGLAAPVRKNVLLQFQSRLGSYPIDKVMSKYMASQGDQP